MEDVARDELTEENKAVIIKNGNVVVKDLDYFVNDLKILSNINLEIKDGEKLGIIGSVGSGKTSLIKNLIGYVLPKTGKVFLSDYDINNIPSQSLREYIGYSSQNIQLFSGSIYDNISSGLENVTEEEIVEAANLACCHEFIAKLPGGYSYQLVENGLNLSGGQRQSITLARALIRKPKILVLDEPTSSMDAETENQVVQNLFSLSYNPTIIISTHRVQHLTNTDKIAVILNGQLARFGPTSEVIQVQKREE